MNKIDYSVTMDYFYPTSAGWVAFWTAVIGLISLFIGFNIGDSVGCIFFALACFTGTFFAIKRLMTKRKLPDVLEEIAKVRETIQEQAANELGIDIDECKEINPVVLESKYYGRDFSTNIYIPEDCMPSNYRFVVLFFSNDQIYYYDYILSLISSSENKKNTGEYFYRDVVAFNTQTSNIKSTYDNMTTNMLCKSFSFRTTGGDAFETIINDEDEKAVQGMRSLLRDKKKAMV